METVEGAETKEHPRPKWLYTLHCQQRLGDRKIVIWVIGEEY